MIELLVASYRGLSAEAIHYMLQKGSVFVAAGNGKPGSCGWTEWENANAMSGNNETPPECSKSGIARKAFRVEKFDEAFIPGWLVPRNPALGE